MAYPTEAPAPKALVRYVRWPGAPSAPTELITGENPGATPTPAPSSTPIATPIPSSNNELSLFRGVYNTTHLSYTNIYYGARDWTMDAATGLLHLQGLSRSNTVWIETRWRFWGPLHWATSQPHRLACRLVIWRTRKPVRDRMHSWNLCGGTDKPSLPEKA